MVELIERMIGEDLPNRDGSREIGRRGTLVQVQTRIVIARWLLAEYLAWGEAGQSFDDDNRDT